MYRSHEFKNLLHLEILSLLGYIKHVLELISLVSFYSLLWYLGNLELYMWLEILFLLNNIHYAFIISRKKDDIF